MRIKTRQEKIIDEFSKKRLLSLARSPTSHFYRGIAMWYAGMGVVIFMILMGVIG